MKLNYILEGLFIQQIIQAVEKRLEPVQDKGDVSLRIVPHADSESVALDFFYRPADDDGFIRFEVRINDGSMGQHFTIAVEGETPINGELVPFARMQSIHCDREDQLETCAKATAHLLHDIFFGRSRPGDDEIKQLIQGD